MFSDYIGIKDEGLRNIAFHLCRELSKRHELLRQCLKPSKRLFSISFWRRIKDFDPHIIHYIPGPTIKSFMIVRALKICCPQAKTVMSATCPGLSAFSKRFVPLLKPDLILTQSQKSEQMFANLGCKVRFLPSGVDTERFAPVTEAAVKHALRMKYGLNGEKPIVLHVGHITKRRNVLILNELQREGRVQILLVGNLSIPLDQEVYESLIKCGSVVLEVYFRNIEEIYALSDCYIFPVTNPTGCIEMPLSVMEAMSCNLPVITTRFGALPRVFKEGDGLLYVEKKGEFKELLNVLINGGSNIRNREKVLPYCWERIANKLEQIYEEILF